MEFAPQPRRWVGALVVTAAAALSLGPVGSAGAHSATRHAAGPAPLPAAGWHGRPIRHPKPLSPAPANARSRSAASIRDVQRMLLRVGYRPGPVDGVLGARTRSSVQWFQIKHGFRATGVVDLPTLDYLRSRIARRDVPATAPVVEREMRAPVSPGPSAAPRAAVEQPDGGIAFSVVMLLAALTVIALWLVTVAARAFPRISAPRLTKAQAVAPSPEPSAASSPAPAARAPAPASAPGPAAKVAAAVEQAPLAIGYALGRDPGEIERNATAIQRACSERGWSLSCLVRDAGAENRRSGLAFALKRMSEESAPRLVVGRLSDLGRSLGEVAAVLAWCTKLGVVLVALDVGLDTRTEHGRLAARCLLALSGRERGARASRSQGRGQARTNGSHAGASRRLSARAGNGT